MYTCPMHPEIRQSGPGRCPTCGMELVREGTTIVMPRRKLSDFTPLIVIFAVILVLTGSALFRLGAWDTMAAMRYFEGFFFLIFAGFKLLNWRGFVDAYATYDIIAKKSRLYGYAYPLIELALGAAYLLSFNLLETAWITLALMLVSSVGVWQELRKGNEIPCACLGVVFKIPMTYVTFAEDLIMAVMAAVMIGLLIA